MSELRAITLEEMQQELIALCRSIGPGARGRYAFLIVLANSKGEHVFGGNGQRDTLKALALAASECPETDVFHRERVPQPGKG